MGHSEQSLQAGVFRIVQTLKPGSETLDNVINDHVVLCYELVILQGRLGALQCPVLFERDRSRERMGRQASTPRLDQSLRARTNE